MKLSANFSLAELTRSDTAVAKGIDNAPDVPRLAALQALVSYVLQPLRVGVGRPVRITSGFRSVALNAAIKGSESSQHMKGEAADLKIDGMTAEQMAREVLRLRLPFDQLIWYAPSRGGHIHVSYTANRRGRGQVLHAPASGGYVALMP